MYTKSFAKIYNSALCARLLNQGYSFVAAYMDLDQRADLYYGSNDRRYDISYRSKETSKFNKIPLYIDDAYLEQLICNRELILQHFQSKINNPHIVAWFRYLAYQVEPAHAEAAIDTWKRDIGDVNLVDLFCLDKDTIEKLVLHWDTLKTYVV